MAKKRRRDYWREETGRLSYAMERFGEQVTPPNVPFVRMFIGGRLDGKNMAIAPRVSYLEFPIPRKVKVDWNRGDPTERPTLERERYSLRAAYTPGGAVFEAFFFEGFNEAELTPWYYCELDQETCDDFALTLAQHIHDKPTRGPLDRYMVARIFRERERRRR